MKRILAFVLACVMLLSITGCKSTSDVNATTENTNTAETTTENVPSTQAPVTTTTATECNHIWKDATCTTGMTCELCGIVKSSPIGHNYGFASCTSPATCAICGAKKGNALGHQYTSGYCIRCNAKDPNHVEYSTIKGNVSYKYNDYVGHRGDTGAKVILFPCGDGNKTKTYDNSTACLGITGTYDSGIMVTKCDSNGDYVFERVPVGSYYVLIISKETTDRIAFTAKETYESGIRARFSYLLSEKDLGLLITTIGLNKFRTEYFLDTKGGETYTFSYDFGVTYY